MSSEQFSEKPLPPSGEKICPSCGAVAPSRNAVACWMCGEKFPVVESPAASVSLPMPLRTRGAPTEIIGFGIAGAIGVALFSVIAYEMAYSVPEHVSKDCSTCVLLPLGVLVFLAVIFNISVRTVEDPSSPRSQAKGCLVSLATMSIVVVLGLLALVAFVVTACSGGGRGGRRFTGLS